MRKRGKQFTTIALITLCALLLSACSLFSKPEKTVTTFMDAMKKCDWNTMESYVQDDSWEDSEDELIEETAMTDFFSNTLSKLTYTIGDVTTNGDTATVAVDITYYDGSAMFGDVLSNYFVEVLGDSLNGEAELTEDEATNLLGQRLAEATADIDPASDSFDEVTVTLNCVKEDGKWLIANLDDTMLNVITSNLNQVATELQSDLDSLDIDDSDNDN